jgi:hypothetical protein
VEVRLFAFKYPLKLFNNGAEEHLKKLIVTLHVRIFLTPHTTRGFTNVFTILD